MKIRLALIRAASHANAWLERTLPEQRIFLKSDCGTHFMRLRPLGQLTLITVCALGLAWTIVATALVMTHSIGATSARDLASQQNGRLEERLAHLSDSRNRSAQEALDAEERFNLALAQVSAMQEMLLASEDRRRELETGIDAVQETLRRTMQDRDTARAGIESLTAALNEKDALGATEMGRVRDTAATLEYMSGALAAAALERDLSRTAAIDARAEIAKLQSEQRLAALRNDAIFARLEEAVTVSLDPMDKAFRSAGLDPDVLLASVRKGYSGQGGPLARITASSMGGTLTPEEERANGILKSMEELDYYRLAGFRVPLVHPVHARSRMSSPFGTRNDPFGKGRRFHAGQDFAAPAGTAVHATADGRVTFAGWQSGYGRLVKIRHDFGLETRYGHLSRISVKVGQKVSRGDRIGDIGSTGRATGPHLHYEVRVNGSATNPMNFIKAGRDVF